MILDPDPETCRHLAEAIKRYRGWANHVLLVLPEQVENELDEIQRSVTSRATSRQVVTPIDVHPAAMDARVVPPRSLTVTQAASRLGVSIRTVWRRVESGHLPVVKDGGVTRFRLEDLDEHIDRHTTTTKGN